jgi:hypothetical protein
VQLDANEQVSQQRGECQGKERCSNNGNTSPEEPRMPLPEPELASKGDGVGAGGVEQGARRKRHRCRVKDAAAEMDEGNDEQELEWIQDVVGKLRGGDVEAKDKRDGEAEERGRSKHGIDADHRAYGDAPGKLLRGRSHAQQRKNRKDNTPVQPSVVGWGAHV